MGIFWNKLGILLLGLLIGAMCGIASIYSLEYGDILYRPPSIFCVVVLVSISLFLRPRLQIIFLVGAILMLIYWLALLAGPFFFTSGGLGAVLCTVLLIKILGIHQLRILVAGTMIYVVSALLTDLNFVVLQRYFEKTVDMDKPDELVNFIYRLGIFLWQTIMMAAITLQLFAERRYRQRLAVQAAADGGASEP